MTVISVQATRVPGTEMSAQDIIKSALRLINALASGEQPTAAEAEDALIVLNQMMDTFRAESLMIFSQSIQDFPLVAGKQTYTLGVGGDFDTPRPAKIDRASVVLISNPANPLEIPIPIYNDQSWQEVGLKTVDTTFPSLVYDDRAYPFRNLSFWPIPRENPNFRMYAWSPLTQFPDLPTKVTFPPAYYEVIRYNLAVRLAPDFQATLRPEVVALAQSAIAKVKTMNSKEDVLISDLA